MHTEKIIAALTAVCGEQPVVFIAGLRPFAHETTFGIYSAIANPIGIYANIMFLILFGFYQIYIFVDIAVKKFLSLLQL